MDLPREFLANSQILTADMTTHNLSIDQFYGKHVKLVHAVARKGYGRLASMGASVSYEDLVQELSIVFMKAYDGHDSEKGMFSSYFYQAGYRHINRMADAMESELNTRSEEEVTEYLSGGDEGDTCYSTIACERMTPDEEFAFNSLVDRLAGKLSPLALKILELVVCPPEFLEAELSAKMAHAEMSRNMGEERRVAPATNAKLACDILKLTGVSHESLRLARKELEKEVRRSVL